MSRGMRAQGEAAVRWCKICHFGRKPRRGGSPARESQRVDKMIL